MREKIILPESLSETEEGEWWDSHHPLVEETLLEALEKGETQTSVARKLSRLRDSASEPIQIPADSIQRARNLAEKKGMDYTTYIQMLLTEALDRESQKAT